MQDAVARGAHARRLGPDFRWPGGQKVAVVFNLAYEGWSDGKAPGIGPMGNPLPAGLFDTNALSWGNYGPARGIERLLRALDRTRQRASIMVSGVFAERTPGIVKAMVSAGHEIVAHCWTQDTIPAGLTAEADKTDIKKTTEMLTQVSGVRPIGWISPRGTPGRDSARHLLEAGYVWQGDVFDDDKPYIQEFDNGRLVAIPLTMEINDLPHHMRFSRSPQQFVDNFDDVLAHALDEEEALMIDVTAHAHMYGRPFATWAYEAIARKVAARDDLWVGTKAEMAAHVLKVAG